MQEQDTRDRVDFSDARKPYDRMRIEVGNTLLHVPTSTAAWLSLILALTIAGQVGLAFVKATWLPYAFVFATGVVFALILMEYNGRRDPVEIPSQSGVPAGGCDGSGPGGEDDKGKVSH